MKMEMADMKLPKMKKEKGTVVADSPMGGDEYPYGLRITLNEDQIKKLQHVMDYKPDSEVAIMAKGKVLSVRSVDTAGGKKDRSVEIQITSIGCDMAEKEDDSDWYGKKKKG